MLVLRRRARPDIKNGDGKIARDISPKFFDKVSGDAAQIPSGAAASDSGHVGFEGRLDAQDKCVVCIERPRTVLLLPCKHLCLCKVCLGQLPDANCPVCRQPFTNTVVGVFNP